MFTCRNICWIAGGLLGLAAFLLLLKSGWFLALLIGVVLAVAVALLLNRLFCAGAAGVTGTTGGATGAGASVTTGAGAAAASAVTAKPEVMADKANAAAAEAETVDDLPSEPEAPAVAEPEPAPEPAPAPEPVAAPGEGDKPALLDAPEGEADNLKLIKGVGPKLEEKLNALGVWHFRQIAGWSAAEVAWVDDQLSFRGRIERDDWIGQAKTLAAGGETEFSTRNK